jgi:hypothetical protein
MISIFQYYYIYIIASMFTNATSSNLLNYSISNKTKQVPETVQ